MVNLFKKIISFLISLGYSSLSNARSLVIWVLQKSRRLLHKMNTHPKAQELVTDREIVFPQLKGRCYLDHAGATLPSVRQIECHSELLKSQLFLNPHSTDSNDACSAAIEDTRNRILEFFHTNSDRYTVIFTSGATDSIRRVGEWFDYGTGGGLCYLHDNHTSVLGVREYALKRGVSVQCVTEDNLVCHPSEENGLMTSDTTDKDSETKEDSYGLFIFPAQSNFSGRKYNIHLVSRVKSRSLTCTQRCSQWYVMVDAASLAATSDLDLSHSHIDFIPISFYKLFGYPTGIGALLVKNTSLQRLKKSYFGGGTVDIAGVDEFFHHPRKDVTQWFEDGTLPYQQISALNYGFDELQKLGGMEVISEHTFQLAKLTHDTLQSLTHNNSSPVVKLYCDTEFSDRRLQGSIVSFNLLRSNGAYIGYNEVQQLANVYKIVFRTGCFCNIGACQKFLNISTQQLKENHKLGHKCGDNVDLMNGEPTGAIRVSFGYMSNREDVKTLIDFIKESFVERHVPLHLNPKACGDDPRSDSTISLTGIRLYPVKSCASFSVTQWELSSTGLMYDRMWSVIDSSRRCLTQKRCAELRRIKPSIDLVKNKLTLTADGFEETVSIPLQTKQSDTNIISSQYCTVKVCGKSTTTFDCGDEIADWISAVLDKPGCRLVKQSSKLHEPKKDVTEKKIEDISLDSIEAKQSLANDSQYLLISQNSVSHLCQYIQEYMNCYMEPEEMVDRFRANFVIEGADPDVENTWVSLAIDNKQSLLKFQCQGECARCSMISIDQYSGEQMKEPLRSLTLIKGAKASFGIHLSNIDFSPGLVRIGDRIVPSTE